MKYKVGDVVLVKPDLQRCASGLMPEMKKLRGEYVTIARVGHRSYEIKEDHGAYFWSEDCFEAVFLTPEEDIDVSGLF